MNVKEYIKSGVIESYVLGIATEAERQEFEQTCATYPEVAEARDAFERSLEEELMRDAVPPPAHIKEKIFLTITPPVVEGGYTEEVDETPVRRMNPWKWIAAASLLLLAGVGYWAYTIHEQYERMRADQAPLQERLQQTTAQLEVLQQDVDILRKPGIRPVSLNPTAKAPGSQTTIFWDTTGANKDVYMIINNLPKAPNGKQYQLWALLNDKPIDLGVFDLEARQQRLLIRMKNVQNAEAFAITLEDLGGKPAPEGDIYVMGEL